jgi:hypothetical protein
MVINWFDSDMYKSVAYFISHTIYIIKIVGEFMDGELFHENIEGLDVLFEISCNQIFTSRFTPN